MKKNVVSLIAFAGGLVLLSNGVWADMTYVRVSDLVPDRERVAETSERALPVEYYMNDAVDAHTLQVQLKELKTVQQQLQRQEAEYAQEQKRMKALVDCNIKRLSEQFKDPAAVWQKITNTYDAREKDLAIYINSAEPVAPAGGKTDLSAYSDQEISEMMLHWSLGNEIMTDVYANQDKWGERKNPKAPSFPLWEDQKFFFDKDWNAYYTKLNTFFGAPLNGRPAIGEQRYDYNRAGETRAAHEAYVTALKAKNPQKALLMPDALKKGPAAAPRPLPPVQETVLYLGDVEKTHQIFPAWPEPWRKQIENNFANYNMKGEMAKDFVPKSFKIKDTVAARDPALQNNRLNVYQLQKKKVDGAKKAVEATQTTVRSAQKTVQDGLNRLQIPVSANTNLLRAEEYEKLVNAVKAKKYELIGEIDKQAKNDPTAFTARTLAEALKKDPEAQAYITVQNAADIDQLLLEAAAVQALQKEQEKFAEQQKKSGEKQIDDMCLNGGF